MLPDEDETVATVRSELKDALEYAALLLDFATNIFDPDPVMPKVLPGECIALGLAMYTKLCRAYRGTIGAIELGLGEVGATNCRVLFESAAALCFVFRDVVRLKHVRHRGVEDADTFGEELSVEFRTTLFELNKRYETRRWVEDVDDLVEDPELIRPLRELVGRPDYVTELEMLVGEKWAAALNRSKHYSGV
jgi:hypothetical protein